MTPQTIFAIFAALCACVVNADELVDRAELAPIEDLAQSLLAPRSVDARALAGEEG